MIGLAPVKEEVSKIISFQKMQKVKKANGLPVAVTSNINMNPGLQSRFSRYIHFPDYSAKGTEQSRQVWTTLWRMRRSNRVRYYKRGDSSDSVHS